LLVKWNNKKIHHFYANLDLINNPQGLIENETLIIDHIYFNYDYSIINTSNKIYLNINSNIMINKPKCAFHPQELIINFCKKL
jgi:hypothetical protein